MVALDVRAVSAGWLVPSHADPFGQHCGDGRCRNCNLIKAAGRDAAKPDGEGKVEKVLGPAQRMLGTVVRAR
jgi:hypothetical protein